MRSLVCALMVCGLAWVPACLSGDWCDDFENGVIDVALWVTGGVERGFGWPSEGVYSWSHEEIVAADGFLQVRITGPSTATSYGAEAWVRAAYDFNDGHDHIINFTWGADVNANHIDDYYIQVTNGAIPDGANIFWMRDTPVGSRPEGTKDLYFAGALEEGGVGQTDLPPTAWSIAISAHLKKASLFEGPDLTGSRRTTVDLDPAHEWYVRFYHVDGNSAGFPATDNFLYLYDFCASVTLLDSDGDGYSDSSELEVGTDPEDPFKYPIPNTSCCDTVVYGDVNGDGFVTNLDALMVQARFMGLLPCFSAIDYDCNGRGPECLLPELTITLPGDVTMDFVLCQAGSFQMGSNEGPDWSSCYPCEQPIHMVTIAQPFYMGKYEVTQGQWHAIMGSNPSYYSSCGDDCPVEQVSWNDCQTFIANLNAHITSTGQGPATFRLPSEAEWEYACRAGTTTRFSFGDSTCLPTGCASCDLSNYAWWCGNNSPDGTKPVGAKLPNAWGLHDMHGNVWEWCQDRWHDDYAGAPTDGSAWTQGDSIYRVLRGGNWGLGANRSHSSSRDPGLATYPSVDGVRLTRSIAP